MTSRLSFCVPLVKLGSADQIQTKIFVTTRSISPLKCCQNQIDCSISLLQEKVSHQATMLKTDMRTTLMCTNMHCCLALPRSLSCTQRQCDVKYYIFNNFKLLK